MAVLSVDVLRQRVDYSITVFRAGFITLGFAVLAFLYLLMTTAAAGTVTGALIIGVTLLFVPLLCFVIGLSNYAVAARTLSAVYGDKVSGLLRRRSNNLRPVPAAADTSPSNIDEASWQDIISRLGEDEGR